MNDVELMVAQDLAAHQARDGCECPFPCPNCGVRVHWDMGLEGHICTKCDWYDGVK